MTKIDQFDETTAIIDEAWPVGVISLGVHRVYTSWNISNDRPASILHMGQSTPNPRFNRYVTVLDQTRHYWSMPMSGLRAVMARRTVMARRAVMAQRSD